MIVLFTDFGWNGPYVGQIKAVLCEKAPGIPVIDLMHDVPSFDTVAASYLLASLVKQFPQDTVFISVVDPGVGHPERMPYMVQADGRWFIGPDNGLFNVIEKQADEVQRYEILWRPASMSSSFHGRDLFAPVAAMLTSWEMPENRLLESRDITVADDLYQVIYLDHYGNAMTGIQAGNLSEQNKLIVMGRELHYAETFSMVTRGEAFWYFNSNGLVEIAVNQGSAMQQLSLQVGSAIDIE
ncbi:MAG: SAM-dependent chlorinase/fluorinase [Gammaproteobacteria bacterium]